MEMIFIIEIIRDHKQYKNVEVINEYFSSEKEAKKYLLKKYGLWLDEDHLYIYYGGLNRFKISDETGIRFHIKPLIAA